MRYFKYIIIFILTFTSLNAKKTTIPYTIINKKLNYELEFKNIPAGKGYIIINQDSLDNKPVMKLTSEIKTNKYLDLFYRIRNKITIYMNDKDLSLIKVINKINEGGYKNNHHALVDIKKMRLINSKGEKEIKDKVYSPLSVIFSIREKLLNLEDEFYYKTYSNGKQRDINISLIGKEKIKTAFGEFNTVVLNPTANDKKSVLKNNGDMKVWYTDDQHKIPIKIEIKIKYGSIVLLLNRIS